MKKVKLIMALLMATLIMTLICPVSADEFGGSFNESSFSDVDYVQASTQVTLRISDGFIVTIPQSITLTTVRALNGDITYRTDPTNINNLPAVDLKVTAINASKRVNVTISGNFNDGNWTLIGTNHTTLQVPYYLKADNTGGNDHIVDNDIINKQNELLVNNSIVICSNKTTNVKLHALVAQNPDISDNFEGTLTFTVKYEDNPDVSHHDE